MYKMPNYENGKIYTIRSHKDTSLIYVGSTCNKLSQRLNGHKYDSKKYTTYPLYEAVNGNWEDFYIELYEEFPCKNKESLNQREGQVIREIATLNIRIAGRTHKENYNENIVERREKAAQYREENREKIREWDTQYRENNKEKLRERNYQFFLKIKEKKYEKRKEKMKCCCGCMIRKDDFRRHERTEKHKLAMNIII